MNKRLLAYTFLLASLGSQSLLSANDGINIFNDIQIKGELRPRYETASVSDNNLPRAQAFTNRTHLVLSSKLFDIDNLKAIVGLQSVNNFGYTDYSLPATSPKKYDVINDPNAAMLSEASLEYSLKNTTLHAGRSQLNLDNQRFIGTVGWRQLERSYDTLSAKNNDLKNLDILVAYLYGSAGVSSVTTAETNSALIHVKYKVAEYLHITAYDYMIGSLSDTYGLALTGKLDKTMPLSYHAEYAQQSDPTLEYQTKNVKADAYYVNLDLATNLSGFILGLNYELFSGSDVSKTTFNPKLGTNHKFNGWADVFFVGKNSAPTGGLIDANLRLGYKTQTFGKLLAIYHDFTSDKQMSATTGTTNNLGSELDFVYVRKIPGVNNLTGLAKYASYSKGDVNSFANAQNDKQVAWLQLDYKF